MELSAHLGLGCAGLLQFISVKSIMITRESQSWKAFVARNSSKVALGVGELRESRRKPESADSSVILSPICHQSDQAVSHGSGFRPAP
jgi:hypothetical protein